MSIPKMGIYSIGLLCFLLLIVSVAVAQFNDQDTDIALKEATRQAAYHGINKGAVRTTEEITLNPEKTKEAFIRSYAEQAQYKDGNITLYIHDFSSKPAMFSTETYHTFDTPLPRYLNFFDNKNRKDDTTVRELETGIFEAKETSKVIK